MKVHIDLTTAHVLIKTGVGITLPIMIKSIPLLNNKLGKPIVMEEFGIMRESESLDPNASIKNRDLYLQEIFEVV